MERQNTYETVGIIGAMKVEIEEIQKKLQDVSTETISGIEYVQGMLSGKKVIAAKCGVGKVFAAVCAQTMVLRYAPDCILQTGVAGGLTDPLAPLDLVVATHVVQYDMDTSAVGDPPGMLSGINIVQIPCDGQLIDALCRGAGRLGRAPVTGIVATGDTFVCTEAQRSRIREQFAAVACEMEGGAVGQVCYINRVPFGMLRCISDGAGADSAMDYAEFVTAAANSTVQVVEYALQIL